MNDTWASLIEIAHSSGIRRVIEIFANPSADLVNGMFEGFAACLLCLNVKAILRSKRVEGVHLLPHTVLNAWGWFNLYYYPSLNQWFSFAGAVLMVTVNTTWFALALYYRHQDKRAAGASGNEALALGFDASK